MNQCQSECCSSQERGRNPREDALKLLEEFHQFPCEYQFKVIGYADKRLGRDVRLAAEKVLGPLDEKGSVSTRPSSQGRYESVTVDVLVRNAEEVLAVYHNLRQVAGLVSIF